MSLKDNLKSDLKEAMKSKDVLKRDVIRFLNSAVKQIEVDERRELSDSDILKVIQKSIKQRVDSIAQYRDANRDDLADKEEAEVKLLKKYLPEQLSDGELETKLKEIISKVEATTMRDIGKVMQVATKELSNVADGKRINQIAKSILS